MRSQTETFLTQLLVSEHKYTYLYEGSPDLYRTINTDGIILECNNSYAKNLGYSKEEIIGKTIFDHVAEISLDDLCSSFETWKKKGYVTDREIWFKRKNGIVFPGLLSATNLYDKNGKLIGSNTVIRDLSEIREAKREIEEQKTKRLSDIGEMAARIAHDLRNPLSTIKNSVELIKINYKDPDENTLKHFSRLENSILRMAHQIEDVLDYVKPKSLVLENHSLLMILNSTLERIQKPDTVAINLSENDVNLTCDSEKLEIVFINLITNAIQAMNDKGTINIRISEQSEHVLIEVEDNGPGIPERILPKIFDPLFTTRQIGTGLGLPSCKSIIEKHGGIIDVKTVLGKGTTFIIKLPKKALN